jgi:hypothetical protein
MFREKIINYFSVLQLMKKILGIPRGRKCPLISGRGGSYIVCHGEDCMWYIEGDCAVVVLARAIKSA